MSTIQFDVSKEVLRLAADMHGATPAATEADEIAAVTTALQQTVIDWARCQFTKKARTEAIKKVDDEADAKFGPDDRRRGRFSPKGT